MAIDADEEILQDFLIEAEEILELLSEQLVELENNPQDNDLLNSIFRGYHTVKGGAGFLGLKALVDICHIAENIFDLLRNGEQRVTPELMDVSLRALDCINDMFEDVKNGDDPASAETQIISDLERYSVPLNQMEDASAVTLSFQSTEVNSEKMDSDPISEDEFEALLDDMHGSGGIPGSKQQQYSKTSKDDDFTDDEFEALLNEIHGEGPFPGASNKVSQKKIPLKSVKKNVDLITDEEFESLLNDLQGDIGAPSGPAKSSNSGADSNLQASTPSPQKKPVSVDSTVRVDTSRLDDIMNMVGELVLVRNRMMSIGKRFSDESLRRVVSNLDSVTGDLQTVVMKTRMQPIKKVLGRFPRVVRDLARKLKKEIKLELIGEETELDKNLVEALADPLVHLVRNAVDHGIEMPNDREKSAKPRLGKIILSASQEGDHILLKIVDDGSGMDQETLRGLAVKKGMMDQEAADRLSESDCYNLILEPGFSTKEQVSDISGRGVGMDVVKTRITQLNGSINIDSEMGIGTTIIIKVPLTLAILPSLMIVIGDSIFALPLASVNEIFHLDLTRTNRVDGQLTIILRDKVIPLFYLEDWLLKEEQRSGEKKEGHVVIFQNGTQKVGFVVDSLIGQEEVVIKPLGALLLGTPGMAGATITSDGSIALILDVPSLFTRYA
jgi:two-component system chemotaxis sensor kinase CheA